MPIDDQIKRIGDSTTIVAELIKVAGDTPEAIEAGRNIGKTAVTVTKTINNVLIPLAAVNFAIDKARIYFNDKFNADLSEKTKNIPADEVIEPKASVAGPLLQGLAFTHEETDLKNMYLNLLSTAMDKRVSNNAHPAFVEIIKQLNAEEAHMLKDIFSQPNTPKSGIVEVVLRSNEGKKTIATHVANFVDDSNKPALKPELPAMIDNWIRLGLISVDYTQALVGEENYSYATSRPEYLNHKNLENKNEKLIIQRGIISKTSFGIQFANAVSLTQYNTQNTELKND